MSATIQTSVPSVSTGKPDDDWEFTPAIPVEDDPFFTPEHLERLRRREKNSDPRKTVCMTFDQVHALINVFNQ
ncbi:MAG: hypothetical protein LBN39_02200 [Planctomycetaceae bacterium]|jgi:hypothetical protein|nr:hypothetical protein [Planctomycetaceae bacterium]